MARTTFTSGTKAKASEVNSNFIGNGEIKQIYTGTDLNLSVNAASQDSSLSHELTAITAAQLGGADYLVIRLFMTYSAEYSNANSGDNAQCTIKIETKDVGGSYSDSMAETTMLQQDTENTATDAAGVLLVDTKDATWIHTLTNDEKTNGIQVRITSRVITGTAAVKASIGNKQIVTYTGY